MTTDTEMKTVNLNELDENVLNNALFILDHGWNILIEHYSKVGASILLPNFEMGHELLIQTIIRQGKTIIATSNSLWLKMREALFQNEYLRQNVRIMVFENENKLLFSFN